MEKVTGCGTALSHDEGCKNETFFKKIIQSVITCVFFTGMKQNLSCSVTISDSECLRIRRCEEYLETKRSTKQKDGEHYIMWSSITCTLHQTLLGQ
jgi:hypothetical protein